MRVPGWNLKNLLIGNQETSTLKAWLPLPIIRGGFIIFGVKDKPRDLVGMQSNKFESIDEAEITAYLNSTFVPEILFEKFVVIIKDKTVGVLRTRQEKTKPFVCIRNDGNLKEAEIYYRYNARSEKIKYPELKMIFDFVKEEERKSWMDLFGKISKIGPTNVAIMDTTAGKIKGRNLDVQITNDPNALVLKLQEEEILKRYPFTYNELLYEMKERFSDFKQNNKFHELRKKLMKDEGLCKTRYLDPSNPKSIKKYFYSKNILEKFDNSYTKR